MGVGQREKEGKEARKREQPGPTGARERRKAAEKRQAVSFRPNHCLKARHAAVSFEAAEWSERLTSRRVGWLGAAAAGSIPTFVTFFSFSSLLPLFLSSISHVW